MPIPGDCPLWPLRSAEVTLMLDVALWQSLPKQCDAVGGYFGARDVQLLEFGQSGQVFQPGIGDLGAAEVQKL